MSFLVMACGHAGQATSNGRPSCVICDRPKSTTPMDPQPSLEGRTSVCLHCLASSPSSPDLAYFWYKPGKLFDEHYCGCRGWD